MNIELRGLNFFNKGAELMLHAVIRRIRKELPDSLFVMENSVYTPRNKHLENGIYTKAGFKRFVRLKYLFALIPASILKRWHYVTEWQIDVVLDCSGFAFGDAWGAQKASDRLGKHIQKWKRSV